jgi:hypothetical protein
MSTLTASKEWAEGNSVQEFARETVEQWSELCQRFLDRQKIEILAGDPSPEKLEQHRLALKWMLRFARALHLTAADPDYPDKSIADELEGRMLQLEHSWRMVHERMPEEEADKVLQQVFPE